MNIARGNRKIKAYQTGQVTIRRVDYSAKVGGKVEQVKGFILIAYFEGWQKAHSIDAGSGKPFEKGRLYPTIGEAWKALKNLPNCKRLPSVCMPLAKSDYYYRKLAAGELAADKR